MEDLASRTVERGGKRLKLLTIARVQRTLILIIAMELLLTFGMIALGGLVPGLPSFLALGFLFAAVVALVQTVRLAVAVGGNIAVAVLMGLVMLIPFAGILCLAIVNSRATRLLLGAGVTVGFFGVPKAEMHRLVEGACSACGYDLRGLPGDVCPECGAVDSPR